MSLINTGQPQNSQLVVGGSDVSSGNPVPVSGSVTPASAAAPTFGSVTVTGSAAKIVASTTTFALQVAIYPDPSSLVYIGGSGVTAATGAGNFALQPGGPPLVIAGSIDLSTIYSIAASSGPVISYVGQ